MQGKLEVRGRWTAPLRAAPSTASCSHPRHLEELGVRVPSGALGSGGQRGRWRKSRPRPHGAEARGQAQGSRAEVTSGSEFPTQERPSTEIPPTPRNNSDDRPRHRAGVRLRNILCARVSKRQQSPLGTPPGRTAEPMTRRENHLGKQHPQAESLRAGLNGTQQSPRSETSRSPACSRGWALAPGTPL